MKIFKFLVLFLLVSCVDPVVPEYEYKEGLIFIEGMVSTSQGGSYTKIRETAFLSGDLSDLPVKGARVRFRNSVTNVEVPLTELDDIYVPPNDFKALIGESWELLITLQDGRNYKSKPEKTIEPTPFDDLKVTYDPELLFQEASNTFAPGHFITLDVDDPADEENYYFWKYRAFEELNNCGFCIESAYRNGGCRVIEFYTFNTSFMYACETDCWNILSSESINLFSDEFTNGKLIDDVKVAEVLLLTKENILVEVQQISLSPSAYKFYKILKDLIDNNGGFNSPPPAALIGNVFNPDDSDEFVLGRFTAASTYTKPVFIYRSGIQEKPLVSTLSFPFEDCTDVCFDCAAICITVNAVPCVESQYRTGIRPSGWIDL